MPDDAKLPLKTFRFRVKDTQHSTAGAGKLIGIPAQTIQEVCDDYIDRRRGARKAKLRWRRTRSLGWIAFKNQTITIAGGDRAV
jgi:hypothetical protein